MIVRKAGRYLAIVLALAFSIFAIAGCASSSGHGDGGAQKDGAPATRTVVDGEGREVKIPSTVEKIIPLRTTDRKSVV